MTSHDSSYVWHMCHGTLHVAANLRVRMRAIAGRFVHQRSRAVAQRFIGGYEAGEMGLGGQRRRFFVVQSDDDPALIDALCLVPLLFHVRVRLRLDVHVILFKPRVRVGLPLAKSRVERFASPLPEWKFLTLSSAEERKQTADGEQAAEEAARDIGTLRDAPATTTLGEMFVLDRVELLDEQSRYSSGDIPTASSARGGVVLSARPSI